MLLLALFGGVIADRFPKRRLLMGTQSRLKAQLDLALLTQLAQRHPGWSFVLVGPLDGIGDHAGVLQQFAHLPNVHLLGGKAVSALPAYTQHLDVCMLCYEVTGYTKFIYPLKLHEYLASGRVPNHEGPSA